MKRVLIAAVACTTLLSGAVQGVPLNMMKTEEQAALSLQTAMDEVNTDIMGGGGVDTDDVFKVDDGANASATAVAAATVKVPVGRNRTAEHEALVALKRKTAKRTTIVASGPAAKAPTGATGPTGAVATPPDFGYGDTGITGALGGSRTGGEAAKPGKAAAATGATGATGATAGTGATGMGMSATAAATMIPEDDEANERDDPPESALAHSKQLSDSVVEKVKALAESLHDETVGVELGVTAKKFLHAMDLVQKKLIKTMGPGVAFSPEYLRNRYPDDIATCERATGKKILNRIKDNLFTDAAYVHDALVEKLPRTDEVKTMIGNTADLLKDSTEFVNNIPRCMGECDALKAKAVTKEEARRQAAEGQLRLKCVQEQVQVEGAMAEKIKASDANAEAAEAGMLKFSKAVVDMSEKINAKMDRIKALKAKLQALQHDVQTMELGSERAGGKGKTSPAKMLSNIRTKCMQEAAELSDVEVEENHELLHGVSRARKVAISMQEKSIQLSRRLSMEVKRAPNFSNEKLCKATLAEAKDKMMLPNPLSDRCNECRGVSKVDKANNTAHCVWGGDGEEKVVECEEIAFLSGKCQPPKGLPDHCYDAILYGPKAIRDYLKRHGFPLFTPPAKMSTLSDEELEKQLGEETGGQGESLAEQLRRKVEEMNNKLGVGEDEEEEEGKRHGTGATGVTGATGTTGTTGAAGTGAGSTGDTGSTGETGGNSATGGVRGSGSGGTGAVGTGGTGSEEGEGKTEVPAGPNADLWN